ncbi:MAG: hypothetical protein KC636_26920, partial [Myxococcales bacterium]|nr:hypothetical protein [Myxococcales bacterium]
MMQSSGRGALALALCTSALVPGCFRGGYLDRTCEELGTCEQTAGTTEVDTTTGTTTTSSSDGSDTGTETETDTGNIGDDVLAFRLKTVQIVDPHLYAATMGGCADITTIVNLVVLQPAIDSGDVNIAVLFPDYDPNAVELPTILQRVTCDVDAKECFRDGETIFGYVFNVDEGACADLPIEAIPPQNLALINDPQAPCFQGLEGSVSIQLSSSIDAIDLIDAQFSAAFDDRGDPQQLVSGVLRGFITQERAEALTFVSDGVPYALWTLINGGGGCVPVELPPSDVDVHEVDGVPTTGVWFFINFTAEKVTWSPVMPTVDTDTDTDTTTATSTATTTTTTSTSETT